MNRTQRPNWITPGKNSIVFTQFLLPDGRTRKIWINRPDPIVEKANKLKESGCIFDVEVLSTGDVSMTIMWPTDGDECLAHEIVPNDPRVPEAVDRLVEKAYHSMFESNPATEGDKL